uniref:Uncharacterized protein n=1 Tax=Cucumis melo TaxID=3656 RepID=A0A9I9DRP5_CUCME
MPSKMLHVYPFCRLKRKEVDHEKLQDEGERRCKSLKFQLKAAGIKQRTREPNRFFFEERDRREIEDRNLRKKSFRKHLTLSKNCRTRSKF